MKSWKGANDHFANFIDAVRSRKNTDLTADIEEGHVSSALCHLGNISCRVGEPTRSTRIAELLRDRPDAALVGESFERMASHLDANGVDTDEAPLTMGPWMAFDPARERFVNSEAGNALLRRDYRAPFVVPEEV